MTSLSVPALGTWKVLVAETQLDTSVGTPVQNLPSNNYQVLLARFKLRGTIGADYTQTFKIRPFASFNNTCDYLLNAQAAAVVTPTNVMGANQVTIDALLGTTSSPNNFTFVEYMIYGCSGNIFKWAFGRYIGIRNGAANGRSGWWTEQINTFTAVDGFMVNIGAERLSTGSTIEVYQIE